jgi:hypothetical protein
VYETTTGDIKCCAWNACSAPVHGLFFDLFIVLLSLGQGDGSDFPMKWVCQSLPCTILPGRSENWRVGTTSGSIKPGTPLVAFVDGVISVRSEAGAVIGGPGPAIAAGPLMTFVLRNGDKLTGSVESMVHGVYTVVTRNGALRIGAAEIQEIRDAVAGRVIAARSGHPEKLGQ